MSIQLRGLDSRVRPYAEYALQLASHYRIPVTVTSVRRTWAEQLRLYKRYLAGRSRFPANRPGDSSHQFGLSFDSVVAPSDQANWNAIRRWIGFGVPDNDQIHAEVPGWRGVIR